MPRRTSTSAGSDRPTTTEAGLGAEHQRLRAELMGLLRAHGPRPCRRCGRLMLHPAVCPRGPCPYCRLDLGHLVDRVLGGGSAGRDLEHARCNRAAGARLGNSLRRRRPVRSRRWV